MSRKYKFLNPEGLYFISFSIVKWIDLFTRDEYCTTIIDNLNYCIQNKGMNVFGWCIMPSHIHMIFKSNHSNPSDIMRDFKTFTSKQLLVQLTGNLLESRRDWMLKSFKCAGKSSFQLWQPENHPIELWSAKIIDQKLNYIHDNPVKAGFVLEPHYWKHSSAIDYSGGKGLVDVVHA